MIVNGDATSINSTKYISDVVFDLYQNRYKSDYTTWEEAKNFIKVEGEKRDNLEVEPILPNYWVDSLLMYQTVKITFKKKEHWKLIDAMSRLFYS